MEFDSVITADSGEPFALREYDSPVEQAAIKSSSGVSPENRGVPAILSGHCPNGALSDGICRPSNNSRYNWMALYGGARVLPIGETILLGTHNSGFDKKAGYTPSSETCQDVAIYDQLAWGVRSLDLRVQFFAGRQGASRFAIYHDSTNGRYVETDILQELLRYRRNYGAHREVVILNFHRFKNFTTAAHQELARVIKQLLGKSIVPPACKDLAIAQLWALNMNTVVSYNDSARDASFWVGVNQRWIGSNTPSKKEMGDFIDWVGGEQKGFGDLRSVQAAYYSLPFFTPKDLSGDLMSWFAATENGGPISRHYIINTDWSLRQRLADNVIYANAIRARQRGAHVIESSPNSAGGRVQTQSYGIFSLGNGSWIDALTFTANTSGYPSIQVIANDADWSSRITWPGHAQAINKGDRLVFRVESGGAPVLIASYNVR